MSSILSLAVLLTIGRGAAVRRPSSPASAYRVRSTSRSYDLGNVLLLAGILLFPHGRLSWRMVVLIACLPVLMFLHGTIYQSLFVGFMIIAVLMLLRCMRQTQSSDLGSRSAGRCSASAATPCSAAYRSCAIISNGRPTASGISCWSRCRRRFPRAWASSCCSSGCSSRCCAFACTTPKRHRPDGEHRARHARGCGGFAAATPKASSAHLTIITANQQRRADRLSPPRSSTMMIDPIRKGSRTGPSEVPEEPVPASRGFAGSRARHA